MAQRGRCTTHRINNCNLCYLAKYKTKVDTRAIPDSDSDSTLMDVFIPAPSNKTTTVECDDSTDDIITSRISTGTSEVTCSRPQPCPQPCPTNSCEGVTRCFNEPCVESIVEFINTNTNTSTNSYLSASVAINDQYVWLASNPDTATLLLTLYNPRTFVNTTTTFIPAGVTVDAVLKISVSTDSRALILIDGGNGSITSYIVYYVGGMLYQLIFPSNPGYNPIDVIWSATNNYFSVVLTSGSSVIVGISNTITITGGNASATLLSISYLSTGINGSIIANIDSTYLYVCDIESNINIVTLSQYEYTPTTLTLVNFTTAGLNLPTPYSQWSINIRQLALGSKIVLAYTANNLTENRTGTVVFGTTSQITTQLTGTFIPYSLAVNSLCDYYVLALLVGTSVELNVYSMTSSLISTVNANNLIGTTVAGVYVSRNVTMVLDNYANGEQQLQIFTAGKLKQQGIIVDGYLNFGTVCSTPTGMLGYGLRDNNGIIEFKNKGGTWIPLSSL